MWNTGLPLGVKDTLLPLTSCFTCMSMRYTLKQRGCIFGKVVFLLVRHQNSGQSALVSLWRQRKSVRILSPALGLAKKRKAAFLKGHMKVGAVVRTFTDLKTVKDLLLSLVEVVLDFWRHLTRVTRD
jgi:hypothetical protein